MMKRFITIAIAILLVAVMVAPVFAETTPSRTPITHVPTEDDLPDPKDEKSEDRYFVDDQDKIYVRDEDFDGELKYFPEDALPVKYELIEKVDPWTKGKDGDAKYVSNAPYEKREAVYIDKALVDAANYTFSEGSTEVTFTKAYMETLAVAEHEIVIKSTDGYAKGTFKVIQEAVPTPEPKPDTPKTDDNSINPIVWVAISLVSLGAIGVVAFALAKKRTSAEN